MLWISHSFIADIYIAPLEGYYSEALPTIARLKRTVFRPEQNVSERTLGSNRCANGTHSTQRANHQECTALACGSTGKRNKV